MAKAILTLRGAAVMCDLIIVSCINLIPFVIIFVALGIDMGSDFNNNLFMLILVVVMLLYHILLEGPLGGGQTLGKKIMGIKVTTEDGDVPSYRQSAIRTVLRIIDWFPTMYIIGAILIETSEKDQRLGDRIAETIVVLAKTQYILEPSLTGIPEKDQSVADMMVETMIEENIIETKQLYPTAAILSMFIPGLGQLVKKHYMKAVVACVGCYTSVAFVLLCMRSSILILALIAFLFIIIWIWVIYDALTSNSKDKFF